MKSQWASQWVFYLGLSIDVIALSAVAGNVLVMQFVFSDAPPADGLSGAGRKALWLIPLAFAALIGAASWLKSAGKLLAASILLWIPALPLAVSLPIWMGLAAVSE